MQLESMSHNTFSQCRNMFIRFTTRESLEQNKVRLTGLVRKYADTGAVTFPEAMLAQEIDMARD